MGERRRLPSDQWSEYNWYELQNFPTYKLFELPNSERFKHRPADYSEIATEPCTAYYLVVGMSMHTYAYRYEGKVYGFSWESAYDEMHRAMSGSSVPTWYDEYEQGDAMAIRVNPDNPVQHCFEDPLLQREIHWCVYNDFEAIS